MFFCGGFCIIALFRGWGGYNFASETSKNIRTMKHRFIYREPEPRRYNVMPRIRNKCSRIIVDIFEISTIHRHYADSS